MDALNLKTLQTKTIDNKQSNTKKSRLILGKGTSKQVWMDWQGMADLRKMVIEDYFPQGARIVIISPHPDDEILGCAGLIQLLHTMERKILVIGVTNGTASHPNSKKYSVDQLNVLRPLESRYALDLLVGKNQVEYHSLGLDDGQLIHQTLAFEQALEKFIHEQDILITTYEKDGHPDHESLGRYVRAYAHKKGLQFLQFMVWAWHWAKPNDKQIDWSSALRLDLKDEQINKKANAIYCFKTQIENDETTGSDPIVPEYVIDRILMPWEIYFHAK